MIWFLFVVNKENINRIVYNLQVMIILLYLYVYWYITLEIYLQDFLLLVVLMFSESVKQALSSLLFFFCLCFGQFILTLCLSRYFFIVLFSGVKCVVCLSNRCNRVWQWIKIAPNDRVREFIGQNMENIPTKNVMIQYTEYEYICL